VSDIDGNLYSSFSNLKNTRNKFLIIYDQHIKICPNRVGDPSTAPISPNR
jgi:hypothetical protein